MISFQRTPSEPFRALEEGFLPGVARRKAAKTAAADVAATVPAWSLARAIGQWWRTKTQPARQMRLVETLPIGPKRSVALLELDGCRFLAGLGNDGVTTLLQVQENRNGGERLL